MGANSRVWVLEFLLRRRSVDADAAFFQFLPSIVDDGSGVGDNYQRYYHNRLKKTILLRSLERDAAVTDRTLETLELIEQVDRDTAKESPSSLKEAYCAVAEELTLKHLRTARCEDSGWSRSFDDAVDIIWNCRIARLEISEAASGLFSEPLRGRWKEMEQAVGDSVVQRRLLLSTRTAGEAFDIVLAYVEDAFEQMGPSLLETMAAEVIAVNNDDKIGSEEVNSSSEESENFKDATDTFLPSQSDHTQNCDKKVQSCEEKEMTINRKEGLEKHPTPSTEEVLHVRKTLKMCSEDLCNAVKDPLLSIVARSDELLKSAEIDSLKATEFENRLNQIPINAPATSGSATGSHESHGKLNQEKKTKQSIMERNSTAHTIEWNDSIESQSDTDKSANDSKRLHLPSPKRTRPSPITLPIPKRSFRRNGKKIKWSLLEEDALREGVKMYGKGNWKTILNHYSDVFELRNDIDLKDKWRNMTR